MVDRNLFSIDSRVSRKSLGETWKGVGTLGIGEVVQHGAKVVFLKIWCLIGGGSSGVAGGCYHCCGYSREIGWVKRSWTSCKSESWSAPLWEMGVDELMIYIIYDVNEPAPML